MFANRRRIKLCNRALEAVRSTIPADLYRDVYDYVNRFGESGLGMEVLIEQLSEFEIKITREQFELIQEAMASMGLGECDRVEYLRENGVNS